MHSPELSDDERLVIEYADVLSRTPVGVSDDLRARMNAEFSEKQIVELTNEIAWEHARARFNRGLGIESDGFDE